VGDVQCGLAAHHAELTAVRVDHADLLFPDLLVDQQFLAVFCANAEHLQLFFTQKKCAKHCSRTHKIPLHRVV